MFYTKEMIFTEFKMATQKDERNAMKTANKQSYKNRIAYLTALKEDMIKAPKNFSNLSLTTDHLQNLIDDWSAPKPIDAFYKRVFNMTYAEKKSQEEAEYFTYDENGKKREVRKSKEATL
jgi:hypothetical protein